MDPGKPPKFFPIYLALPAKCATSSETLDEEWQPDFWMLTA
jgi:hypothetical protein